MQAGLFILFIYFFVWRGGALRVAFMGHCGGTIVTFTVLVVFYGALGWDPCSVYNVSSFLLGIVVGRLWRFSAFVAFMRHAGWSVYFIYLFIFCVAWRGVVGSVYGALGWDPYGVYSVCIDYGVLRLDVCGFHSICSVYRALGLVLLVAFRLLVVFMGDWGGTRLAFTALVVFMGHWR